MKPSVSELDGKVDTNSKHQRLKAFYKFLIALSPISYLARARDCYVGGMNKCAGMGSYGGIAAAPIMALPISFTSNSSSLRDQDDDYRELMKAASLKERATTKSSDHKPFPRSLSTPADHSHLAQLGVGRIDEESPCYFSASFKKTADEDLFHGAEAVMLFRFQNMNLHRRRNAKAM